MAFVEGYWRTNPRTGKREYVSPHERVDGATGDAAAVAGPSSEAASATGGVAAADPMVFGNDTPFMSREGVSASDPANPYHGERGSDLDMANAEPVPVDGADEEVELHVYQGQDGDHFYATGMVDVPGGEPEEANPAYFGLEMRRPGASHGVNILDTAAVDPPADWKRLPYDWLPAQHKRAVQDAASTMLEP